MWTDPASRNAKDGLRKRRESESRRSSSSTKWSRATHSTQSGWLLAALSEAKNSLQRGSRLSNYKSFRDLSTPLMADLKLKGDAIVK